MEHLLRKPDIFKFDDAFRTRWLGFDHSAFSPTSFADYATERGWDKERLLDGDLAGAHPSQQAKTREDIALSAAAMAQSWLYFGFLEGICEERVDTTSFISATIEADGYRTLHSNELFDILKSSNAIATFLEHHDHAQAKVAFDLLAGDLVAANEVCNRVLKFTFHPSSEYPEWAPLLESILPSILLMLEAIEGMAQRFYPTHPRLRLDRRHFPPDAQCKRLERLTRLGWCPFTLDRLNKTTNNSVMSWIEVAQFKRETNRHTSCESSQCRLYQIDPESYQTKHVSPTCKCSFQSPNLDVLQFSLRMGKVPAITVITEESQLRLDITTFDVGKRGSYVAFSHVWADGLGSVSEVGLPECQIKRLATMASVIPGCKRSCFWIDSLCVPRRKDLRQQAITLMAKSYSSATAVVVLDREIQMAGAASSEEIFLSICGSGWMGRLWTYQEAALARRLVFKMKDGLYELIPSQLPPPTLPLITIWTHLARQLRTLTSESNSGVRTISSVQATLAWRQTSKPDDETLAIVGILGLDASILQQHESEARKATFWKLLRSVPQGVIHLPGRKLSLKGFRWAPQTLMYRPGHGSNTMFHPGEAICTDDGLIGDFEGLFLKNTVKTRPDSRIYLHQEGGSGYEVIGVDDSNLDFAFDVIVLAGKGLQELVGREGIGTAILLTKPALRERVEYCGECTQRLLIRSAPDTMRGVGKSFEVTVQRRHLCLT
jgi:hypothetical protein